MMHHARGWGIDRTIRVLSPLAAPLTKVSARRGVDADADADADAARAFQ
jgi:hypothetical protein